MHGWLLMRETPSFLPDDAMERESIYGDHGR